jgi:hypothetical protein
VNVCLGSAFAIGPYHGQEVHLGLDRVDVALLVLTLFVSALTFGAAHQCAARQRAR